MEGSSTGSQRQALEGQEQGTGSGETLVGGDSRLWQLLGAISVELAQSPLSFSFPWLEALLTSITSAC